MSPRSSLQVQKKQGHGHELHQTRPDHPFREHFQFPAHLQLLHYVGVPLSGTVTPKVRSNYNTMRPYGPNDGVTLLPDQLLPQGHVVIAIGADHRFVDPRTDLKTLALASLIVELVEDAAREG